MALELTISPAAEPELYYGNLEDSSSPTSIDAILSEDRPSLSVTWDNSVSLTNDALDQSVAALAGTQPGLTVADPDAPTPLECTKGAQGKCW